MVNQVREIDIGQPNKCNEKLYDSFINANSFYVHNLTIVMDYIERLSS